MAEFGENLKRVREQKGITQQTLADYLYVTRQAVSRWEGGSRYPDIMTAKKMAMVLSILYFGIFTAIAVILGFDKMGIGFLLFGVGINAVMLCISALFFAGKGIKSPVPLYIGLATVFLLGVGNLFVGMSQEIPNEILRDVILLDTFSMIGNTLVLALLAFMAHTLHKKRKLAAR